MAARRIKSLFGVSGQRAHREHRSSKNRTPQARYRKQTKRMRIEHLERIARREHNIQ